jgi:hypothetical protein
VKEPEVLRSVKAWRAYTKSYLDFIGGVEESMRIAPTVISSIQKGTHTLNTFFKVSSVWVPV